MAKTLIKFNTWIDDLSYYCPAQCYYYFQSQGIYYCIYLRWRWKDPWSASLIKFKDEELDWDNCVWFDLKLNNEFKQDELEELKIESRKMVIKILRI